ncbi:MAG: polysulfide reductase NrfD [Coriobacteriia bacterium]|nr:polysulfide reductase NrfD [Coriobacteriia bacterium]
MISHLAICYLFLGGAGGGGLFLLSLFELLGSTDYDLPQQRRACRDLCGRASVICLLFLAAGVTCLWFDLGRSGNIGALLASPQIMPMTVGALFLAVALLCAVALSCMHLLDNLHVPVLARQVLCGAGVLSGLVTVAYTGFLLGSCSAVAAWQNPLLIAVFVLSSLSGGHALLLAAAALCQPAPFVERFARVLQGRDTVVVLAEGVVLFVLVIMLQGSPYCTQGAWALLAGDLGVPFWALTVAVGLVAPLVLERAGRTDPAWLLAIALCVLIGAAALRWCLVSLAQYDPSAIYAVSQYDLTAVIPQ